MPWLESTPMTKRVEFCVDASRESESFSELCRSYGVSRKTGYKWLRRYEEQGPPGLGDRSRAPRRHANETAGEVVERVLEVRRAHPTWGARKIVAWLARHEPEVAHPVASTVGEILKRHGLTSARRRTSRVPRMPSPLTEADVANSVWTMDFKGQFPLGNGTMCWPLTVMDLSSRYLVRCQGLSGYRFHHARPVLLAAFQEYGLPTVIRSDNGAPFACRGPGALSAMGVWFLELGIRPERIKPGCPTQNGAHERMHRTLKADCTRPAAASLVAQQRRFNEWMQDYNTQRPHESLDMMTPQDHYTVSTRAYPRRLRIPCYPSDWRVATVDARGVAHFKGSNVYVGHNLNERKLGFRKQDDTIWEVWYLDHCLGHVDELTTRRRAPTPLQKPVSPPPGPLWR